MDNDKKWEIISEKEIFTTPIFDVYELDCYLQSKDIHHSFISLHLRNWVNIFALTADKKILLVKQHRLGKDIITYEVPAGAIDQGEDPEIAAKRELAEETGYTTDNMILLREISPNPAIQNNTCYIFLALDCVQTTETNFDETEELEYTHIEVDEIFDMSTFTKINNAQSLLAVYTAREYLIKHNIIDPGTTGGLD